MTDREKLVELLNEAFIEAQRQGNRTTGYVADHLLANGVTVQGWISVKDELPKSEVLAANFAPGTHGYKEHIIGFVSGERCTESGGCFAENDYEILHDVTHWMSLPKLPKEE